MITLAKALYDNTAECPDELAFRKGDVLMVMEQDVAGTSGWWMCSLYGRQGLAPANRLHVLPQTARAPTAGLSPVRDKQPSEQPQTHSSRQNIYQIPSVPRANSDVSEQTELLYKIPSTPLPASRSPKALKQTSEEQELFNMAFSPRGELYDVPSQGRRGSLFPVSTTPRLSHRKHSLIPISELQKSLHSPERLWCDSPRDSYTYVVPPTSSQDPNYDIPIPSTAETQKTTIGGSNTLPILRKSEWIYDVPVSPNKQSPPQAFPEMVSPRPECSQLYDTIPARANPVQRPSNSLPNSSPLDSPPTLPPRIPIPSKQNSTEKESVYDIPHEDPLCDHIPLECWVQSPEVTRIPLYRWKNCPSLRNDPGKKESQATEKDDRSRSLSLSPTESQRISTASSSSSSSCDSLALSSSSPEPLREVTLGQEEVSRRLLDLQNGVCKAVPQIMEFVSSGWRSKHHLEKHLEEIREAAQGIASSLCSFLNFALDIKGNAHRLSDANLQARLCKQLCIVEDSGVILQQTVSALNAAGWPLNLLSQEAGQVQTPDQLERFVMVARTIPEDVKRLVSMINANGKLLFKPLQKDPELVPNGRLNPHKGPEVCEQEVDVVEDDYVELQQKEVQKNPKENATASPNSALSDKKPNLSESSGETDEQRLSSLSEHCKLYFGALQKALGGFVSSLQDGQPPEKFISQSKLVIMVGQRLVDALYREAHRRGSSQSLLCKSNHLCALLKQLAVATKKAALHFPDRQAVCEAQEFAKELAQRAQHFRLSLDL